MPLITLMTIARSANQGRIALKWTPACTRIMRAPNQVKTSCILSKTFGLPFFQLEASFLGYLALNEEVASVENLSGIENFSMVKELLIVNTLIADITPLTLMPELEVLTIEKSLVEDYSPLESLKNLRVLQVERKYMDNESISFLREKLPNLTINYFH